MINNHGRYPILGSGHVCDFGRLFNQVQQSIKTAFCSFRGQFYGSTVGQVSPPRVPSLNSVQCNSRLAPAGGK
jgi:hypothetical protein